MTPNPSKTLGTTSWWQIPAGPLGAFAAVYVVALLFGANRTEAAWYGTTAASLGLAYVLLIALPLDGRTRAVIAIPLFLLMVTARWVFTRDLNRGFGVGTGDDRRALCPGRRTAATG